MLFHRVVASLPFRRQNSSLPRTLIAGARLIEIVPSSSPSLFLLKQGTDPSLQLVVMASVVLGSAGLEQLLSSVPWTVHAFAVGVKDYWIASMRDLPGLLRGFFSEKTLVALVDAYDVMLFPCDRFMGEGHSVVKEYASFGKDIVWAADTSCHPNRTVCKTCPERYAPDSPELEACWAFPNLNG